MERAIVDRLGHGQLASDEPDQRHLQPGFGHLGIHQGFISSPCIATTEVDTAPRVSRTRQGFAGWAWSPNDTQVRPSNLNPSLRADLPGRLWEAHTTGGPRRPDMRTSMPEKASKSRERAPVGWASPKCIEMSCPGRLIGKLGRPAVVFGPLSSTEKVLFQEHVAEPRQVVSVDCLPGMNITFCWALKKAANQTLHLMHITGYLSFPELPLEYFPMSWVDLPSYFVIRFVFSLPRT